MRARHIFVPPGCARATRLAFFIIGALALSLSNIASAQDREIRIRNWGAVLTVNTDGSLDVTERLSIKFTGRWSRFERNLSHRTPTGRRPYLDVTGVSATDAEGQQLQVETYGSGRGRKSGRDLHVRIWMYPWPMNENRDVIIRYHVTNAIRFDELHWSVNDVEYPIDKADVVVVLPTGVVPTRALVYTRDSDRNHPIPGFNPAAKVAADAKIEINGNTVGISLPRAFRAFEIMTIAVGWPSGPITGPIKAPKRPGISMIHWWPVLIPLIIFVAAFTTWQRRRDARALLLIGALSFSFPGLSSAQDRVNRIRNLDAVLTVRADGTLDVTEELTIQVAAGSNEIVRDLSLRGDGARKGSRKLDVKVLAVSDEDGLPLRTEESSADSGWARRLRIWIPGAGNADLRISISYRISNAVHLVNAGNNVGALDEVRWNLIGDADMPIDSVHARMVLPAGARPTRTAVSIGPGDSAATDATTRKNGNEVSFTLSRGLWPQQSVTLSVGLPVGYIHTKPSSSLWGRLAPALSWWPLLIPLIVFVLAFRAWDRTGRDPKEKSYVVRYEPVDAVSAAGLGKLVSGQGKPNMRLIVATLVDLAVRGFLRIEETTPNILLTLTKDVTAIAQSMLHSESGRIDFIIHFVRPRSEWKGLKWHEERLLDGLINAAPSDGGTKRDSVRISMLSNKFYVSVPEIMKAIEFELVSKGYYRKSPGGVNMKWIVYASIPLLVGGIVGRVVGAFLDLAWLKIFDEPAENASAPLSDNKFLLGMLLSTLILIGFAAIMPSRSVAGARAREAALGFKEFLSRVDTMPSVESFERYLPYAIAFGVQNSWARAFEGIYGTAPAWYSGPMGEFSPITFGHRISDLCISAASSMSSRPSEEPRLKIEL